MSLSGTAANPTPEARMRPSLFFKHRGTSLTRNSPPLTQAARSNSEGGWDRIRQLASRALARLRQRETERLFLARERERESEAGKERERDEEREKHKETESARESKREIETVSSSSRVALSPASRATSSCASPPLVLFRSLPQRERQGEAGRIRETETERETDKEKE